MTDQSNSSKFDDWGMTQYAYALEKQMQYVRECIAQERKDTLVFTEHHQVYTIGSRKDSEQNVLLDETALQAQGIEIAKTNRGGDVTYHGPGQLIGYPIISLNHGRDLHLYLRNIEQVIINALGYFGLACHRREGKTGLWLEERKIAAIGIAVKQWIAYHGFSINVNTDLSAFGGIVPCGISPEEGTVTSIKAELGRETNLDEVKKVIAVEFWKIFDSKSHS